MSRKRQSNRPDRRILGANLLTSEELDRIRLVARYTGAPYHKLHPGDYGLSPPSDPRPSKSVCDDRRPLLKHEAESLLREGIRRGMISQPKPGQLPKYVWAVDDQKQVYEAKTDPLLGSAYHGYRLGDDEYQMRANVLSAWNKR